MMIIKNLVTDYFEVHYNYMCTITVAVVADGQILPFSVSFILFKSLIIIMMLLQYLILLSTPALVCS